jgi:hypothetical protein
MPALALASLGLAMLTTTAVAEPRACQKGLAKASGVLAKQTLRRMAGCLDKENAGKLPGPCPDAVTDAKLAIARSRVEAKIAKACAQADLAGLPFSGSCAIGFPEGSAAETSCGALPVTTPPELAACVTCWQRADLMEYVALLYASHAVDVCGDLLGLASVVCSQGGCASLLEPVPDQRDLTGSEADCQRAIAKGGAKYLATRAKLLGTCARSGGTRESCLGDAKRQLRLAKAASRLASGIGRDCGGLRPTASVPFCCRTGGNSCVAAATREECAAAGGDAQDGRTCDGTGRCRNAPGGRTFTWWSQCPRRACGNFAVSTIDDLVACVQDKADETVDGSLCQRAPADAWPCPSSPSGAFLDRPA